MMPTIWQHGAMFNMLVNGSPAHWRVLPMPDQRMAGMLFDLFG
jgi:hypothetical protein